MNMNMDIEDKDSVEFKKAVMEKRQQVLLEKQRTLIKAEKMDKDGVIILADDEEEVNSNEQDDNEIDIEMPAGSVNKSKDKIKSPHKKHSRIKPTVQTNLRGERVNQLRNYKRDKSTVPNPYKTEKKNANSAASLIDTSPAFGDTKRVYASTGPTKYPNLTNTTKPKDTNHDSENKGNYAFVASAGPKLRKNVIRLNLTFPGFQQGMTDPHEAHKGIRDILLPRILAALEKVDPNAKLMPFSDTPGLPLYTASTYNIGKVTPNGAKKYINIRAGAFLNKKNYYRNGIRITSDLDVDRFVDLWTSKKRECDNNNSFYFPVQRAETQQSQEFHLFGFCSGSTERQEISTLQQKIQELPDCSRIELSWQNLLLPKNKHHGMWKTAESQATALLVTQGNVPDKNSINRKKFLFHPSALCLYAPTMEEATNARRQLATLFGKAEESNSLPCWFGISYMRFVPLAPTCSTLSEKVVNQIVQRAKWHIYSKATEVTLQLPCIDPFAIIPGSKASIATEIMELRSKESGIPLFKQISTQWSSNPEAPRRWRVTLSPDLELEAVSALTSLEAALHDKYGTPITEMFTGQGSLLESTGYLYNQQSKSNEKLAHDIEKLFQTEDKDPEGILAPGWASMLESNDLLDTARGADSDSTIKMSQLNLDDSKSNEQVHGLFPIGSDESKSSSDSSISTVKSFGSSVAFAEGTEFHEKKRKDLETICKTYKCTVEEFHCLKNDHAFHEKYNFASAMYGYDQSSDNKKKESQVAKAFLRGIKTSGELQEALQAIRAANIITPTKQSQQDQPEWIQQRSRGSLRGISRPIAGRGALGGRGGGREGARLSSTNINKFTALSNEFPTDESEEAMDNHNIEAAAADNLEQHP